MTFEGFSEETIDFLWQLRMNNNKAWMEAHRQWYTTALKQPFEQLSKILQSEFSQKHKEQQFEIGISRINRDIRFSKDKSPYKARRWLVLKPHTAKENWKEQPVFYFELTSETYFIGMGFYDVKPQYMQAFRNCVDAAPAVFERIVKQLSKQNHWYVFGETYKKDWSKGKYSKEILQFYNQKSIDIVTERNIDTLLFSPDLVKYIITQWELFFPMYEYFQKISE